MVGGGGTYMSSATEAAIQSFEQRKFTVPPLYLLQNCINSDDEEYVHRVIDIPVPLDGKHAYDQNATCFDHVKLSNTVDPLHYFLQTNLLMVEKVCLIGGYDCLISYQKDPAMYDRVVNATARVMRNKANQQDRKLKADYTKTHQYVDLRFAHDVEFAIKLQNWEEKQKQKGKGKGKQKQKTEAESIDVTEPNDDDDDEEEADDNDDDDDDDNDSTSRKKKTKKRGRKPKKAIVAKPARKPPTQSYEDFMSNFFFGDIENVDEHQLMWGYNGEKSMKPNNGTVMDKMTDGQLKYTESHTTLLSYPHEKVREMKVDYDAFIAKYGKNLADRAKAEFELAQDAAPVKTEYFGPGRVNKIDFTLTAIPHALDKKRIGGFMARFLIRDPSINTGLFYNMILQNVDDRATARNQGRFTTSKKRDLFPEYMVLYNSFHPAGNFSSKELYAKCLLKLKPELKKDGQSMNNFMRDVDYVSNTEYNMTNFFSTAYALKVLEECGCDRAVLGSPKDWWREHNGKVIYPSTCKTYKYLPQMVFWYSPTQIGLREQMFPFIDSKADFLKRLRGGENMRRFFENGKFQTQAQFDQALESGFSSVEHLLTDEMVVTRAKLCDTKIVPYDTNNEFIHKAFEAEEIYKKLSQAYPAHYPLTLASAEDRIATSKGYKNRLKDESDEEYADFLRRVDECEYYNALVTTTQDSLMKTFQTLFQLEGNIDGLPISGPIKTLLKWYRDNHRTKLPNMTRDYMCWDQELDMFGNTMIQQLATYIHFAGILQPVICLLSEGLFSCYDGFMKELSFHMMIHGKYDTGKTYTAIKTLIDYTCIKDTVSEYSLNTKAADTTRNHAYDEIVASDECPRWITSKKDAEQNQEQVDKEKIKLTRGQITINAFEFIKLPNGDTARWNQKTTCDHKKACVYVTNASVESKEALSSRMFRITVKQSKTPANEKRGRVDETFKSDSALWLNINQFLSACGKKAAAVGAIFPEVEMSLFDDISSRALHYLRGWGCVKKEQGSRSLGKIFVVVVFFFCTKKI